MPRYNPHTIVREYKYDICVSAESLDAEGSGPYRSSATRYASGSLFIASALYIGYGSWKDYSRHPVKELLCGLLVMVFFAWGMRSFLPFGERLHCDGSTLTWSKIPWISFGNRWVMRSIPVSEISGARYGLAYRRRGGDLYGILLEAGGQRWKLFAGIESPEANRILHGLRVLGANVQDNREMRYAIRETLRDRKARF
jgi:hypothetical protein